MSRNNNDIWTFLHRFAIIVAIIGGFSGMISTTIVVLTYLEKRSLETPSAERITPPTPEPKKKLPESETRDRPTQDSTPTQPRVDWKKAMLVKTLTGHSDNVYSVAIAPDGKTLASGSLDNTIKIWSYQTHRELATLTGHSDYVSSVAISPDGKTLASGNHDGTIKIWSLETNRELATLTGHSSGVRSVAIAPDGKTLASGSLDKTIKIWSYQTHRELATLTGHSDYVSSVAIAPNGKTLVSGSQDNTIKIWKAGPLRVKGQ